MKPEKFKKIIQKLFNKAYKGLAKQDWKKSVNSQGHCRYRGESECRCFVGHLIPNNMYDIRIEGKNIFNSNVRNSIPELLPLTYDNQRMFLGFLEAGQSAHDNSDEFYPPYDMRERMHALAKKWELDIPKI